MRSGPIRDRALATLASDQHGLIATSQLMAMGFSERTITNWLARGRLVLVHRGVYRLGHDRLSKKARWRAATLAIGGRAALSHQSAGAAWDIHESVTAVVHVLTPPKIKPRVGIRVHWSRWIEADHLTVLDGIPITSIERTLYDLADVTTERNLELAFNRAESIHGIDWNPVMEFAVRSIGRRGRRRFREVVSHFSDPSTVTRGKLEERLLGLCDRSGIPRPRCNVPIEVNDHEGRPRWMTVDALWRDRALVVEMDSIRHHLGTLAFENDRRRDVALNVAGYRVLRFTWRQVTTDPAYVAASLQSTLAVKA